MAIIEQEQIVEQPAEVTQAEELEENLKVTIDEPFMLGLCFGLGFGAALIFYGIIALVIVKNLLDAI